MTLPATSFKKVHKTLMDFPVTGQFMIFCDYWWTVTDDGYLLFYGRSFGSPQCNSHEAIQRKIAARNDMYPWPVHVEQIPVVYVPLNISDY